MKKNVIKEHQFLIIFITLVKNLEIIYLILVTIKIFLFIKFKINILKELKNTSMGYLNRIYFSLLKTIKKNRR